MTAGVQHDGEEDGEDVDKYTAREAFGAQTSTEQLYNANISQVWQAVKSVIWIRSSPNTPASLLQMN